MRWGKKLINKHLNIMIIIFFEFFGTALFGFTNINLLNKAATTHSTAYKEIYLSIDFALSLFVCISYGRQFSGGLYNPAITLFRMLRKNERIPLKTGLLYISMQFLGSIFGCCIAFWIGDLQHATITRQLPIDQQMRLFSVQIMGTGVFAIMLQTIVEKKMTFIQHNRQFYICIPLFFTITRQYSAISNGMNPALGFGYELGFCLFNGKWDALKMSYILVVGPFIGVLLAVGLFEFILIPLYPLKRDQLIKQIQSIQKQRSLKQRSLAQKSMVTIRQITFAPQKYSIGQIINTEPQNEIYIQVQDDYTMIGDDEPHNQIRSLQNLELMQLRQDISLDSDFKIIFHFTY